MMEQMTLSELKVGMHVKLRDGSECVVAKPCGYAILIDIHDGSHEEIYNYEEDMRSKNINQLDIVEVRDIEERGNVIIFAEETMTKAEAEAKFGIRIVD